MKKLNKIIASFLISISILALLPVSAHAAWKRDNRGWWYTEANAWAIGWRNIDGSWYYFSPDGYMITETTVDGCYLNKVGEWVNDTNFNVKAAKAEEIIKQNYYSSNVAAHARCSGFDGSKWTVRVYEDNQFKTTNIGWYYADINTGNITKMQ